MAIDKIFNDGNVDGIADNIFNAVNNSVSEVKQMQQRKAAENAQMVVQSLKKIDTDIRSKFDNVTNTLEKRIITIKDGRDGINGKDGRDGKDGKAGRDGKDGKQGIQGLKGQDGIDGLDGVSVANANIDFDGSLIIALSNGQEINVGEVVSSDLADKIQVISTMSTNGAVGIKDEGSSISTGVKNINFVGATVTATNSGDDVTVNVSAGTGTVTSVGVSGGTTGLTATGSPITTTGTITLGGTLAVANGGTGTASPTLVAGTNITSITGTWPNQTINASGGSGTVTSVAATVPTFLSVTGSPITTSGTLAISLSGTALPVANGGTGITSFGTGVATFLGTPSSANLAAAVTDETGSGALVFATSPTLVTPALGTPSSGTVTNLTGTASININGTVGATTASSGAFTTLSATGVTTVQAGTAALPAITTTGDTNTGIFFPAADTIAFAEGGVEAMRIDSSGNLLVGRTSANGSFSGIQVGDTTTGKNILLTSSSAGNNGLIQFRDTNDANAFQVNATSTNISLYGYGSRVMQFYTNDAERMRIDTSGNLLVNTTSTGAYFDGKINSYSPNTYAPYCGKQDSSTVAVNVAWNAGTTGDNLFEVFVTEASPTPRGSISYNRTGGLTAYNTTSDYRAKDITGPVTDSGALIDSVPVYIGKMKDATQERPMFIAHETPAYAHTGEKDAVDKDGNPKYQQMDASALIPVMWAEIQSLRKRIAALESN